MMTHQHISRHEAPDAESVVRRRADLVLTSSRRAERRVCLPSCRVASGGACLPSPFRPVARARVVTGVRSCARVLREVMAVHDDGTYDLEFGVAPADALADASGFAVTEAPIEPGTDVRARRGGDAEGKLEKAKVTSANLRDATYAVLYEVSGSNRGGAACVKDCRSEPPRCETAMIGSSVARHAQGYCLSEPLRCNCRVMCSTRRTASRSRWCRAR
jgi:hypothetical protein